MKTIDRLRGWKWPVALIRPKNPKRADIVRGFIHFEGGNVFAMLDHNYKHGPKTTFTDTDCVEVWETGTRNWRDPLLIIVLKKENGVAFTQALQAK